MGIRIGLYNLRVMSGGGGEKRTLAMAEHLSRRFDVTLLAGEDCAKSSLEQYFSVNLSRVRIRQLPALLPARCRRALGGKWSDVLEGLTEVRHGARLRALGLDVFINNLWGSNLPCPARSGIYMCMFPHELRGAPRHPRSVRGRLYNRLLGMPKDSLDSYDVITANSAFTASWIRKLWAREAVIVYSAGEPMGPPITKQRWILHVGRFVDPSRLDNKHQGTLIEAFRSLRDLHAAGWELHLAGTLLADPKTERTVRALERAAADLPVHFHFNVSFEELRDLYRKAAIYWHGTGFGSVLDQQPERQEHFGITTVEAMSAGAVPVVINCGGQPEIVTHQESGFVWDSVDELIGRTHQLAENAALRLRMGEAAQQAATRFSRSAFLERIDRLVDGCIDGHFPALASP